SEHSGETSVAVLAAAVSDYRPVAQHSEKIKRSRENLTVELEPTVDILADLARQEGTRTIVGFAAETDRVAENARSKLARKGADMIVANDVTREGAGFDTDTNIVTLFLRDGREFALPKMTKFDVANRILDEIIQIRKHPRS
ncbi:MAG: phosphopantothenoylcysteine decarboxylase, partial [Candidatus Acidiferrales bacterium]